MPPTGKSSGPHRWRGGGTAARPALATAVLLPLADAVGDLVTAADFALVRRCQGTGCTLGFLDRTKSHRRRWCDMAVCGNRAKAAAHRARGRQ